jgi:PKD repeat protein
MAEEKAENLRSTVKSWVKAGLTSVVGLVSGAVLMYLTPVVNNVIKPAKPLANFAAQVNGSIAEFNDRSNGGVQGWWDFGDGTALEPFDAKEGIVKHTYASPGTFSVKLSLQNLIGEESERTVPVTIGAADTNSAPEVAEFALEALTGDRVPAAYRIRCQTKNVGVCLLSHGDGQPPEVVNGVALDGRSVSFNEAGAYTVRLYALNGTQFIQKSADVRVAGRSADAPVTARLTASYDAVQIERRERDWKIHCGWHVDPRESVAAVRRERPAEPGCTILSAALVNASEPGCPMRNVNLEVSPDKRKLILTGAMVKPSGLAANALLPSWVAKVKVVMEHRSPIQKFDRGELPMAIALNRTVQVPTQRPGPGWQVVGEKVNLELWAGNHKEWSGNQAVTNAPLALPNQLCYVTVLPQNDGFLVTVDALPPPPAPIPVVTPPPAPAPPPIAIAPPVVEPIDTSPQRYGPYIRPASFERNPLLPQKKVDN